MIPIIYRYNKDTSYETTNNVKNLKFLKSTGKIAYTSNLLIDEDKIKEKEKYDSYYSIDTSEENLSNIEIKNIYRSLSKIENTFKATKSNLETSPVYVWTPNHIELHFLTCFISLVIIRLLEKILENKFSTNQIIDT